MQASLSAMDAMYPNNLNNNGRGFFMKHSITLFKLAVLLTGAVFFTFTGSPAQAADLLRTIQTDLAVIGYDPGPADGELTVKTQLAIGKFEEANKLPVTGQPSLALAAAISNQADAVRGGGAAAPNLQSAEATAQSYQECLQQVAAQKEAGKKRGQALRSLANTGANIAGRFGGNYSLARDIADASHTAGEVSSLAQDLGLTPDEAAVCKQ